MLNLKKFQTFNLLFLCLSLVASVQAQRFVKVVNTIDDLVRLNPNDVHTNVFVADPDRGGLFSKAVRATTNNGTMFMSTNASWQWNRQWSGALSVKWFGAGKGGDDTSEIQSAVEVANAAGGGAIAFPRTPQRYIVSGTIPIYSNLKFEGPGEIYQSVTNTAIFSGGAVTNVQFSRLVLSGFGDYFNTNNGNSTTMQARAISIVADSTNRATRITIDHCVLDNFGWAAVWLQSVHNFNVSDNEITGTGTPVSGDIYQFGISLWDDCAHGFVNGNRITGTAQGIFQGVSSGHLTYGYNSFWDIPGQHHLYLNQASGLVIVGNNSTNAAASGIKIQLADNSLGDAENILISANTIVDPQSHGILLDNVAPGNGYFFKNANITANVISGPPGDAGIYVSYAKDSRIGPNQIEGKWQGVKVVNCTNVRIIGNDIHNTYREAISVITPDRVFVTDNKITNPGMEPAGSSRYGIFLTGNGWVEFRRNLVTNDSSGQMQYAFAAHATVDCNSVTLVDNQLYGATLWAGATGFAEFGPNTITTPAALPDVVTLGRKHKVYFGSAAPTSGGPYAVGDIVWGTATGNTLSPGWICVNSGSPGTWRKLGIVEHTDFFNSDPTNKTIGIGIVASTSASTPLIVAKSGNSAIRAQFRSVAALGNTSASGGVNVQANDSSATFAAFPSDSATTRYQKRGVVLADSTSSGLYIDAPTSGQTIGLGAGSTTRSINISDAGVIVGSGTIDASAKFQVDSTTKGILLPRMTEAQKNAVSSPANGLLIYQTDGSAGVYAYIAGAWIGLTGSSSPSLTPTGTVLAFAGSSVPTGYLACDGSAVSRTTYADLFSTIGTTWGAGDTVTTFNVPDLRGRQLIGAGTGAGLTARTLGTQNIGAENVTLDTLDMPLLEPNSTILPTQTGATNPYKLVASQWDGISSPYSMDGSDAVNPRGGNEGSPPAQTAVDTLDPSGVVNFIIKI